jgi:DNA-directed RNA polymerase subunit beta
MVQEDVFTSIHIKEYSLDVRETKLGPEQTTDDIPNVSASKLKDLDID